MVESTALIVGLLAGLLLGAFGAGLWWSARLRAQFQAHVVAAAERAQRAETLAEELRRSGMEDQAELDGLRGDLAEAMRARAVAETQAAEAVKHVEEQKLLLTQARQELAESFQALSGQALKQNNEAFLSLAKVFHLDRLPPSLLPLGKVAFGLGVQGLKGRLGQAEERFVVLFERLSG